jgi:hypothetical protein
MITLSELQEIMPYAGSRAHLYLDGRNRPMKIKLLCVIAAVMLQGCAGWTDVIKNRNNLYGPVPLNAAESAPALNAYRVTLAMGEKRYMDALTGDTLFAMVDSGIAAANGNCRKFFTDVSYADLVFKEGIGNQSVAMSAITAVLGAAKASYDVIAAWGIGTAALSAYNANFITSVLSMADYNIQSKVWEVMQSRAVTLRAEAPSMTYPQAVDAVAAYAVLCLPQAATAMLKSTLTATTTTVAPSGVLQSTAITAPYLRDDSSERIAAYWMPNAVIVPEHRDRMQAWLDAHSIVVSLAFFNNSKTYEAARKQMVADLALPGVAK